MTGDYRQLMAQVSCLFPGSIEVGGCQNLPWVGDVCVGASVPSPGDAYDAAIGVAIAAYEPVAQAGAVAAAVATHSPSPASDQVGFELTKAAVLTFGASASRCETSRSYSLPVICVDSVPYSPGEEATTFGHFVLCREDCEVRTDGARLLLQHEMVHVGQFEKFGDGFAVLYGLEAARHGTGCENKYESPGYEINHPDFCTGP